MSELPPVLDRLREAFEEQRNSSQNSGAFSEQLFIHRIGKELPALFELAYRNPCEFVDHLLQFKSTRGPEDYAPILFAFRSADLENVRLIECLLSRLDDSDRSDLDAVGLLLSVVENESSAGPRRFSCYEQYMTRKYKSADVLPSGLVTRMYSIDPQEALHTLVSVYSSTIERRKSIQWPAKIIEHALWKQENGLAEQPNQLQAAEIEALTELATMHDWWVRLYVAYVAMKFPASVPAEVIGGLEQDSNVMVSVAAGKVRSELERPN